MSSWDVLPPDVVLHILAMRSVWLRRLWHAVHIQSRWRCYRTHTLIGRFKMLRYLQPFRHFNPCLETFLQRARL